MNYLDTLWSYLKKSDFKVLHEIERLGLHIVPVDSNVQKVALLRSSLPMIAKDESIGNNVMECFSQLGITILQDLPGFIRDNQNVMRVYILPPGPFSLIECMTKIENVCSRLAALDDILKTSLRKYLGSKLSALTTKGTAQSLSESHKALLRKLPIFNTLNRSGFQQEHFECVAKVRFAVPLLKTTISFPEVMLMVTDEESESLVQWLGVQVIHLNRGIDRETMIFIDQIFVGIINQVFNREQVICTMLSVLAEFKEMLHYDPFVVKTKSLEFVETAGIELARPQDLFNPCNSELVSFFEGMNIFPVGEFAKTEHSLLLMHLGLKDMDKITILDLIRVATSVHSDPIKRKSAILMVVIEKKGTQIFENNQHSNLKKELQKLSWVKPNVERPEWYPRTLGFESEYTAPSKICSSKYSNLIGSVQATIDSQDWPQLANIFGWNDNPQPELVIKHLQNVGNWFNSEKQKDLTDVEILRRMCEDIYKFLENGLNDKLNSFPQLAKKLTKLLKEPSIFIDTVFVPTYRCAFQLDPGLQCPPWFCTIPRFMTNSYQMLLKCLGVKNRLEIADVLKILQELYFFKDKAKLDERELRLVQTIATMCAQEDKKNFSVTDIYLPDKSHILRPSSDLWCESSDLDFIGEGIGYLCDPDISEMNAKRLGVQSKNQQVLSSHIQSQKFGQTEKLVKRLKGLLKTASFGIETFKEFIQNADDAGATKIHFILDSRHLPDRKVFGESWKPLQGPAFCIFNDKPFTDQDLQGIHDLGEVSKETDLTKIGQYGVGLSSLYHMSDVPTLLTYINSEQTLCALDPTLQYIASATHDNPGCRYTDVGELKLRFSDVFEGFLEQDYGGLGGTMFRLPLRTKASKISDCVITISSIENLFEKFKEQISVYLLFLNNIREISFRKVCEETGRVEILYTVQAEISSPDEKARLDDFRSSLDNFAKHFKHFDIKKSMIPYEVIYNMNITDTMSKNEIWKIVQRLGFEKSSNIPENIIRLHVRGGLNVLPRGSVAYMLSHTNENLSSNITASNQLFCFLPLPIELRLPVIVNGHFFLDHDTRRTLLNEDTGGQKKNWNNYLMTNVIAPAYGTMICSIRDMYTGALSSTSINWYLSIFPEVPVGTSFSFQKMISVAVYKIITNKKVLPIQRINSEQEVSWREPYSGYFDLLPLRITPTVETSGQDSSDDIHIYNPNLLRKILTRAEFIIFETSEKLYHNFSAAEVIVKSTSPLEILKFFGGKHVGVFSNQGNEVAVLNPIASVVHIMKYCATWVDFKKHLQNTPLLVTEDGNLLAFGKDNVKFKSEYYDIVPHAFNQFIHHDVILAAKLNPIEDQEIHLCLPFTLEKFVKLLPGLLNVDDFFGLDKDVPLLQLTTCLQSFEMKLKLETPWLMRVWKYLNNQVQDSWSENKKGSQTEQVFAQKFLSPLNLWCLLPVCIKTSDGQLTDRLISLVKASQLMTEKYMNANFDKSLVAIMMKLGFPFVKLEKQINVDSDRLINLLVDQKSRPPSTFVMRGLISCLGRSSPLEEGEQQELLKYLSSRIPEWCDIQSAVRSLKKLPLYRTLSNESVSLEGYDVYLLPNGSSVPCTAFHSSWINAATASGKVLFIKNNPAHVELVRKLGGHVLTEVDVYCKFIFKHFHFLTDLDRMEHLKYIRDAYVCTNDPNAIILSSLCYLPFLFNQNTNQLACASTFYNPSLKVISLMNEESRFPPHPFNTDEWIPFLNKCGLISEISDNLLQNYITRTSELANTVNSLVSRTSLEKLSTELVRHVLSKQDQEDCKAFYRTIKNIPFIFPCQISEESQMLHEQHGTRDKFGLSCIPFKDSYISTCSDLVWTVGCVLPVEVKENLKVIQELEIKWMPPVDLIIEHAVYICSKMTRSYIEKQQTFNGEHDKKVAEELLRVMMKIYESLSCKTLSTEQVKLLLSTPCIIIDNGFLLINPIQAVVDTPIEIKPYLYKLPPNLHACSLLIKQLNISAEPTVYTYIRVLSSIHECVKTNILNIVQKEATKRAMEGLFIVLANTNDFRIFSSGELLFLPGVLAGKFDAYDEPEIRLYESSKLIIRDNHLIHLDRLKKYTRPFFVDVQKHFELHLPANIVETRLMKLPAMLRPVLLSEEIKEECSHQSTELYSELEDKFHSPAFRRGIVRLANHGNSLDLRSEDTRCKLSSLNDFHIYQLPKLRTFLKDRDTGTEGIEGSEANVPYYSRGSSVFINPELMENSDVLNTRVAEVLNRITGGNLLSSVLHLVAPIMNCRVEDIHELLDDLYVKRMDFDDEEEPFYDCISVETESKKSNQENKTTTMIKLYDINTRACRKDSTLIASSANEICNDVINPTEAVMWLKQAKIDLESAKLDMDRFNEWACYKCHQVSQFFFKNHNIIMFLRNILIVFSCLIT